MPDPTSGPCAHSANEHGEWHALADHLRATAEMAVRFSRPLRAEQAGCLLGLWHDLGKFHPDFQRYLLADAADPRRRRRGPDHKAAVARLAAAALGPLAMLVQGHHGGLRTPDDMQRWLAEKEVSGAPDETLEIARRALPEIEVVEPVPFPDHVTRDRTAAEFFLRLLFSALVDADFLDTERHFQAGRAARRGGAPDLDELLQRFDRTQAQFEALPGTAVNRARNVIYRACVAAAEQPPGVFRLTVPTGGGKTRSAMAFALRHAARYGQRRVIVAVPLITITEQTAAVYRGIFESPGDEQPAVLEHHSGVAELAAGDADEDGLDERRTRARLAAENWDAPIVVTTTVQLFESLFASRPARVRKLHRLTNSVIIVDEAQALPVHLLEPALDALRQLAAHYGTTVVLSTATQPAFEAIPSFAEVEATEMVPDYARWFESLARVDYRWRVDPPLDWARVAELMRDTGESAEAVTTTYLRPLEGERGGSRAVVAWAMGAELPGQARSRSTHGG